MFFVTKKLKKEMNDIWNNDEKMIQTLEANFYKVYELSISFKKLLDIFCSKVINYEKSIDHEKHKFENMFDTYLNDVCKKIYLNFTTIDNDLFVIKNNLEILIFKTREKMMELYKDFQLYLYNSFEINIQNNNNQTHEDFKYFNESYETNLLENNISAYVILNVSKLANNQEIKKAYITLSKKYHPDYNKNPYAEKMMKIINNAYESLKK